MARLLLRHAQHLSHSLPSDLGQGTITPAEPSQASLDPLAKLLSPPGNPCLGEVALLGCLCRRFILGSQRDIGKVTKRLALLCGDVAQ